MAAQLNDTDYPAEATLGDQSQRRAPFFSPAKAQRRTSVAEKLRLHIARRAYQLYVQRGRREGHALDDWLEAESMVLSQFPSWADVNGGHTDEGNGA
jgi:hypothetical protein